MTRLTSFQDNNREGAGRDARPIFQRPNEVLNDPIMSRSEKQALLASWASDAHAVPDAPTMRRLEDGSIVAVDEVLDALKALDERDKPTRSDSRRSQASYVFRERRRRPAVRKWPRIVSRRRRDDDDDPPPCPAIAAIPPRTGGGGAFAQLEPALA
jgi:hypothetical protein